VPDRLTPHTARGLLRLEILQRVLVVPGSP
jgi:hypothetical protein